MEDSGERQDFVTGAVRDIATNKPRIDLISPYAQERIGEWLRLGAKKYAERNWEKGIPFSRCIASLERHIQSYKKGKTNEDHLAAIAVNAQFIMHYEEMIKLGLLPRSLDDLPKYEKQYRKYNHIRVYLSHWIRGPEGTQSRRDENYKHAHKVADKLRTQIPGINLYVPAENDETLVYLYGAKKITVEEILEADCAVVSKCSFVFAYSPTGVLSDGMRIEVDHAIKNNISVIYATDSNLDRACEELKEKINEQSISYRGFT